MLELATLATTSNTASALELGLTTKTGERPELRINGIARNLILPTSTTERYRVTTPVSNNQQTLFLSVTAL